MKLIEFFKQALRLKETPRVGWAYKGIERPESMADHTYGVSLLVLLLDIPSNLDVTKLLKMSIVFNIPKIFIGDMAWERGDLVNQTIRDERKELRDISVNKLLRMIESDQLEDLLKEFLEQKSPESIYLNEVSKLEMVFQALDYERKVSPVKLDEFWVNAEKHITDKHIKLLFNKLKKQRST